MTDIETIREKIREKIRILQAALEVIDALEERSDKIEPLLADLGVIQNIGRKTGADEEESDGRGRKLALRAQTLLEIIEKHPNIMTHDIKEHYKKIRREPMTQELQRVLEASLIRLWNSGKILRKKHSGKRGHSYTINPRKK
jgi:hypothetical protein